MTQEQSYRKAEEEYDSSNLYVAHQISGIFDEIQRMALAYENNHPIAIEGEPGVGKNHAIDLIANATGKETYRIRCTEEMTIRDIVGGEKLEAERTETGEVATKTVKSPGKLYKAMQDGQIAVIDEINQLAPSVQKGLNSALEDSKDIGYLEGGESVEAKDGFGLFLTYNPDTGLAAEDLEKAVKDRCKITYFEDKPTEVKLRVALLKTGRFDSDHMLEDGFNYRGIQSRNGNVEFVEKRNGDWYKLGEEKPVQNRNITPYLLYNKAEAKPLDFEDDLLKEFSQIGRSVVRTLESIEQLGKKGTQEVRDELDDLTLDNISKLNVNRPSIRLADKVMDDYVELRDRGYTKGEATSFVVDSIVDSTVPGGERNMPVGDETTVYDLVEELTASNGLVSNPKTGELKEEVMEKAREELIEELKQRGYSESVAEEMANEYT